MLKRIYSIKSALLIGTLLLFGQLAEVMAEPMTLTFDDVSVGSINGRTIQSTLFQFTLNGAPSTDALLNTGFTSTPQRFIACPCIEGNANGILSLSFYNPTTLVRFGIALSTTNSLMPGFTVELYDKENNLINFSLVNTAPVSVNSFSEGEFNYSGQLVSRAVINFNESGLSFPLRRFAFDNLTTDPIPEPTTIALLGIGLLGVAGKIVRGKGR
jgi:hypothetical protein